MDPFSMTAVALLIPIVAVVGGIIMKTKVSQMIHQERMAALEKGLPLPSVGDYAITTKGPTAPKDHLRRGLLWAFVGFGLLVSSGFVPLGRGAKVPFLAGGTICVCVGAAYLIFYFMDGGKREGSQSGPEMR